MKEFLDKTGLLYFYDKLCSVFVTKGTPVKVTVTSSDITYALGYTPASMSQVNTTVGAVNTELNTYKTNFNTLKEQTNKLGVQIDTLNTSLTTYASYIDENKSKLNTALTSINAHDASINNLTQSYNNTTETLTTVLNQLDANSATLTNLVSRANAQGVMMSQIQQNVSDTQASIVASVTSDDAQALIEAALYEDPTTKKLNSAITLDADNITVGNIASNITFNGRLVAPTGTIGNWIIGTNSLYSGLTSLDGTTAGTYIGTDGIRNYKDENTYIDLKDGVLTATGAVLSGKITSTEGSIGGWIISDTDIHNSDKSIIIDSYDKIIYIRDINSNNSGVTLDTTGLTVSHIEPASKGVSEFIAAWFGTDGGGSLANGAINWNEAGDLNITGTSFADDYSLDDEGFEYTSPTTDVITMHLDKDKLFMQNDDTNIFAKVSNSNVAVWSSQDEESISFDFDAITFGSVNSLTDEIVASNDDTLINKSGITFKHSTLGRKTITWEEIYDLINA